MTKLGTSVVAALAVGVLLSAACGRTKPGKVAPADGSAGSSGTGGGAGGSGGGDAGADASEVGEDAGPDASCGEPASCPPADDTKHPVISCLSPSVVQVHQAFRLNIYGQYLHMGGATNFSIVTVSGAVLNGALVTPCHITADVGGTVLGTAGDFPVIVSPGGRAGESQPATLTVR